MAGIEELSPAVGPVDTRPPEGEIDEDEDEEVLMNGNLTHVTP